MLAATDTVGETLAIMDAEKAGAAGIRRIPKSNQIRGLTTEALQALFCDPATTALERSTYERELIRREAEMKWEETVRGSTDATNPVKVARAFVAAWLKRYVLGEQTAAKVAWEIGRVLKITYKDAELVVSGGFGFHDAEGVEVNQGMANANNARNLIPPVCAAAWSATFEGQPETVEALSEQVKVAIQVTDPTRTLKAQRKPRTLATVGEAVRAKPVREPKVKPVKVVKAAMSAEEQERLFASLLV